MRICVIGSGISGLSSAHYLARKGNIDVTLYERSEWLGGRANVTAGGEHCPRFFLADYRYLFDLLDEVPDAHGGSLRNNLRAVSRYCHTESSDWVKISHLYRFLAPEISIAERARIAWTRRHSPLLADASYGPDENRYGTGGRLPMGALLKIARNLATSNLAYAFEGPTDTCLIHPWAKNLASRGVRIEPSAEVTTIKPSGPQVLLQANGNWQKFDALIITAFVPDMMTLLERSGLGRPLPAVEHIHCKCLTLTLDPREPILDDLEVRLYCRAGVNMLVQPNARRCVVLCTKSGSTDTRFVLNRVQQFLDLRYRIVEVRVRNNQEADEAVFCGRYVDPARLQRCFPNNIRFAGSYLKNSYPFDSGEGAARSAHNAIRSMLGDMKLRA